MVRPILLYLIGIFPNLLFDFDVLGVEGGQQFVPDHFFEGG